MVDLKPCPFCGGEAELDEHQVYRNSYTGERESAVAVFCASYGAQHSICRGDVPDVNPAEVVELWNRRVELAALREGREQQAVACPGHSWVVTRDRHQCRNCKAVMIDGEAFYPASMVTHPAPQTDASGVREALRNLTQSANSIALEFVFHLPGGHQIWDDLKAARAALQPDEAADLTVAHAVGEEGGLYGEYTPTSVGCSTSSRPTERAVTEACLLAGMAKHLNWELNWGNLDPSDETSDCRWRVLAVNGGRNDREWTLIGAGDTPAEALTAALAQEGK